MSAAGLRTTVSRSRYVPAWPTLAPWALLRSASAAPAAFPFNAEHQTWFYRASNAIYHLFRGLDLQPWDVVLAPDYHSGNEIWAMRAAGARIVFYPMRRNGEPDLDALQRLYRQHRPRVVYVIHLMGWPQPMDEIMEMCDAGDTVVVEDCALSMFGQYKGRPLGSIGDYGIFCLYKTLPVPNGGLLVQNRRMVESLSRLKLAPCDSTTIAARMSELVLEWTRGNVNWVGEVLDRCKRRCGRTLTAMGVERVQVGNIGFDPSKVAVGVSPVSRRLAVGADALPIRRARRSNFDHLQQRLPARVGHVTELTDDACPLFYPMVVRQKTAVVEALRARGVMAISFWNYGDQEAQRFESVDAQYLRDHVVGLPLHQHLTPAHLDYMAAQMHDLQALC